jgi:hypothetical protein
LDPQCPAGFLGTRFQIEWDGRVVPELDRQRRERGADYQRVRPDFPARPLADFSAAACGRVDGRGRRPEGRVRLSDQLQQFSIKIELSQRPGGLAEASANLVQGRDMPDIRFPSATFEQFTKGVVLFDKMVDEVGVIGADRQRFEGGFAVYGNYHRRNLTLLRVLLKVRSHLVQVDYFHV